MSDRGSPRVGLVAAFLLGALFPPAELAARELPLADCRITDQRGLFSVAARCGKLAVPEDPDDPMGAKIALAVAVVPAVATQAKPDPLFLLAGGPGQGATDAFVPLLPAFSGIRRERDIVLVDQRGTGGSNRLDCAMPADSLETGDATPAELKTLAQACLAKLPGRPQFYTTSIAVRDLELVRAGLGYERINLFGGSYGSRVAQHYARRYPERTRTVTLDGVVPPALALVPRVAVESQAALDRIFARCANDAGCNGRFPELPKQYARLRARLAEGPIAVRLADPVSGASRLVDVTRAHLVTMTRMLAYTARTASLMPLLIHEAATRGDYAPLAAQGEMAGKALERMIAMGMHHSVVCSEDAPRFAGAVAREELERSYIGPVMLDAMAAVCDVWPRGAVDADFGAPLDSQVPALLISGGFDPATPAAYGADAAKGFAHGKHVVFAGQGHGQMQLPCAQRLVREFVERGSADALDTRCVATIRPAPFFLSFSGSAP